MKSKIILTLFTVIAIAAFAWWYMEMGPYRAHAVKKIIREFPPAEETLVLKDQSPKTNLPELMPADVVLTYFRGRGENIDETDFYISATTATLKREYQNEKNKIAGTYQLALSKDDVEQLYNIFRTRGFDSIQSKELEDDDINHDGISIDMTLSYTTNGKPVSYKLYNGPTSRVLDEGSDRWLDLIHVFSYMAEVYDTTR